MIYRYECQPFYGPTSKRFGGRESRSRVLSGLLVACVTGARWGRGGGGGSRILGSLSIDDGDGNENGKKAIGLD